jgi:hypothetical protein
VVLLEWKNICSNGPEMSAADRAPDFELAKAHASASSLRDNVIDKKKSKGQMAG